MNPLKLSIILFVTLADIAYSDFAVGPYLLDVTDDSATVAFHLNEPSSAKVRVFDVNQVKEFASVDKRKSHFIKVTGLNHRYGERAILENINLSVDRGEVFALIGPTGAGKTTLLRIIDLLEVPGAGEIYFDGKCIPRSGKQRLEI